MFLSFQNTKYGESRERFKSFNPILPTEDMSKRNREIILSDKSKPKAEVIEIETTLNNCKEIKLSAIDWEGKSLNLKIPLHIEGFFNDGFWEIENKFLNLICIAPTWEESLDDLREEFFFLVETYANSPDDKLSKDALELKKKILEVVGRGSNI